MSSKFEEPEFKVFLQEIVDDPEHCFDKEAIAVIETVLDEGYHALTGAEKELFRKEVLNKYSREACIRCYSSIPWEEMYRATTDHHGHCAYCAHHVTKQNRECELVGVK